MPTLPTSAVRRLVVCLALLAGLLAPVAVAPSASAAEDPVIVFNGRGWGHGRGLSQWGSLGYAVDHGWDWRRILGHYYSNTGEAEIPNGLARFISVRLDAMGAAPTIVVRDAGALTTSVTGAHQATAWSVAREGGQYRVRSSPGGCSSGPELWQDHGLHTVNEVAISAPGGVLHASESHSELLSVCQPNGGRRWYQGSIHAVYDGTQNRTVNHTVMERYLRGVVPRESPSYWGGLGGGKGMHALRAQAVAARSYAAAENRNSYAKTCDTTSCQVYAGSFYAEPGKLPELMHATTTDQAIADTSHVIRTLGGMPARTEFSSSTGGWTAGGTFPAVQDLGDSYAGNPNHTWRAEVKGSTISARYPQIGRYTSMSVTKRNGLGADGGRVLQVVIRGTSGSVTVSGNDARSKLGLKSDWFTPVVARAAGVAVADEGYWASYVDGAVDPREGADWHGDMAGERLNAPVIGMAATPSGSGYWLVAADGGIFSFNTLFYGSTGGMTLNRPVVGMASSRTGHGYWMVASDGGIFSYGDTDFYGSTGGMTLNRPVVGMARTSTGAGYWLVASDGGIFSFGDAQFYGSTGSIALAQPIVGMAPTRTGLGYWLVARDGGIFAFGDAQFHGSLSGQGIEAVGMSPTASGNGYWIVSASGTAYLFGVT